MSISPTSPTPSHRPPSASPLGSPLKIRKTHHPTSHMHSHSHSGALNLPLPQIQYQAHPNTQRTRHSSPVHATLPLLQAPSSASQLHVDSALLSKPHATFTPKLHRQAQAATTGKAKRKHPYGQERAGGTTPLSKDPPEGFNFDLTSLRTRMEDISESDTVGELDGSAKAEREEEKAVFGGLVGGRGSLFNNSGSAGLRRNVTLAGGERLLPRESESGGAVRRGSKRTHSRILSSSSEKEKLKDHLRVRLPSGKLTSGSDSDPPLSPTPFTVNLPNPRDSLPQPTTHSHILSNPNVSPRSKPVEGKRGRKSTGSPVHKSRTRTSTAPKSSNSGNINFTGYNLRSRQISVDEGVVSKAAEKIEKLGENTIRKPRGGALFDDPAAVSSEWALAMR
ncbi:hypothetical protein BT69DRAFT_37303 [Atractiella rhizophila]|nr:hypothetical protein BT69DRAFT_37303 [Atractiella rhizophila]